MFSSWSLSSVVALAAVANALTPVSNWGQNPTGLDLQIYVPAKLAAKPAVILAVC